MSLIHQSLECPSKLWFLLSIRRLLTGFTNIKEYRHFPMPIPRYLGALSFSDLHFPPIPKEKKEPYFEFLRIYATSFLGWEVWPHSHHTDPPKSSRTHGRHLNSLGLTYSTCGAPPLPGAHLSPPYILEGKCFPHAQQDLFWNKSQSQGHLTTEPQLYNVTSGSLYF